MQDAGIIVHQHHHNIRLDTYQYISVEIRKSC